MKYQEFDLKILLNALRHQWIFLIIVVLVFALIGTGAAFVFADRGAGEAMGGADALPVVEYKEAVLNRNYYSLYRDYLSECYNTVSAYRNDFTGRMSLTEEQQKTMDELLQQLKLYNIELSKISQELSDESCVYIPKDFLDDYIEHCEYYLVRCRDGLEVAQVAAEMLATMDAPSIQTDATSSSYDLIISTAATTFELMKNVKHYEQQLSAMANRSAVLRAEMQMKQKLTAAAKELDEISKKLSEEANAIAKENHVIYNMQQNGPNDVQFTLRHTHIESTVQESFVLITLFCVLTGICVGMFFAIYRESKRQKREQAA